MNFHHYLTYQTSMYSRECISSKIMELMTAHNNYGYAMLQHFWFCLRSSLFAHHIFDCPLNLFNLIIQDSYTTNSNIYINVNMCSLLVDNANGLKLNEERVSLVHSHFMQQKQS